MAKQKIELEPVEDIPGVTVEEELPKPGDVVDEGTYAKFANSMNANKESVGNPQEFSIKSDPELWDRRMIYYDLVAKMYPHILHGEPRQNLCIELCIEIAEEIVKRVNSRIKN